MHRYKELYPRVVDSTYTGIEYSMPQGEKLKVVEVRSKKSTKSASGMIAIVSIGPAKRIIPYSRLVYAYCNLAGAALRTRRKEYMQEVWDKGQQLDSETPYVQERASPVRRTPREETVVLPLVQAPAFSTDKIFAFVDLLNNNTQARDLWEELAPRLLKPR